MENLKAAQIFKDIANILQIKGDNPFKIRAYQRAAQNIEGLTEDLEAFIKDDRLTDIPGIGKDISDKIKEFQETGKIKMFEDLKKSMPEGLLDLLNIPSVGPKTAKLLYEKIKIKSIPDLERAIKKGKLEGIFGIKEKTVENILKGIELLKKGRERMPLSTAMRVADEFAVSLKKLPEVKNISTAGSLRRQKETVRDIDILVISRQPEKIMNAFTSLPAVKEVLAKGETKSSVRTEDDIQVDCRVVEEKSFGAALIYFTGSKNFNIKIRQLAIKNGLKVNEYGVFKDERFVCGKTEEEVFKIIGMPYIEPELREDNGEIESALKSKLPKLIELKDIKGDLHAHSQWSDGSNTIAEMAEGAKNWGIPISALPTIRRALRLPAGLSPKI